MSLEPRPLPQETVDGLRPPRAGFPYFAHAAELPFEAGATEYSPVNAWWLADACFLVYGNAEFVQEALSQSPLPEQGYRLDWLGTPEDNRGMVLANDHALVVVFRGTRLQVHTLLDVAEVVLINQNDLWTDAQFLPAVSQAGGRAHAGFLKAFAELGGPLDALVTGRARDQKVWLTGHSLGGALATLAAAHLGPSLVQGLYTYGCPRVGNAAFCSVLPQESYARFVHRDDWVTTVPPEFLGYAHAGTLRPVEGSPPRRFWEDLAQGAGEFASAMREMARELHWNLGALPFRVSGLADHLPIYYATLLWNALLASSVQGGQPVPDRIAD